MGRPSREEVEAREATRSAEFEAAVQSAVAAQVAEMERKLVESVTAQLTAAREQHGTASAPDTSNDRAMISDLVTALMKVADPHQQKVIVSPDEQRRREEGRNEMIRLLIDARAKGEIPLYALVQPVYLSEVLIGHTYRDPVTKKMMPQHIKWGQVPNEAMRPVNDVAKAVYEQFMISIGGKSQNKNAPVNFVLTGGKVEMVNQPADIPEVNFDAADPRIGGDFAPGQARFAQNGTRADRETVRVLGTVAAPAEIQP